METVVQKSENALKSLRLISNLTVKNILDYLKRNGPTPPSELSRKLNISPSTASRCLQDMMRYGLVKAKWKATSIEDRPLKMYTILPNVIRFDYVINEQKIDSLKPSHRLEFNGEHLSEFKDNDIKGVYASVESIPFKFEGLTAEILKETAKGGHTFEELKNKFKDERKEFHNSLKHLMTIGLVAAKSS